MHVMPISPSLCIAIFGKKYESYNEEDIQLKDAYIRLFANDKVVGNINYLIQQNSIRQLAFYEKEIKSMIDCEINRKASDDMLKASDLYFV